MRDLKYRNTNTAILFATIVVAIGFALNHAAKAQDQQSPKGRQWAVLIGCERYQLVSQLEYITNDVRNLSSTLTSWGGYPHDCVLEIRDDTPKSSLKNNIEDEVSQFLKGITPNDTLLFYFSGHGYRDSDGCLYLLPLDFDPQNKSATGISLQWLRKTVAQCPANVKLIILDTCHAGTDKGDAEIPFNSTDLQQSLEGLDKIATLASSTADQVSQPWHHKQMSVFSYWLIQGLKGHADENGDGDINIDELFNYVERNVTRTAADRLTHPQTPRRMISSDVEGVPIVSRLQPQPLEQVLDDIAEQLADAMNHRRLARLGVLEFTVRDPLSEEMLGGEYGLLGQQCADSVYRKLVEKSLSNKFKVESGRTVLDAAKRQKFDVTDLPNPAAITELANNAGGLLALVLGSLISRNHDIVNLRCELLNTSDKSIVALVGGKARLNMDQWATQGRSVNVDLANDERPTPGQPALQAAAISHRAIAKLDELSKHPHPMQDPKYPYRVRIVVAGPQGHFKERQGYFEGNDLIVPLRKGEDYEIWLENRSGTVVTARLLVDGLNTHPQPERSPLSKGYRGILIAAPVALEDAQHWVLDPEGRTEPWKNLFRVEGFVTETGDAGRLNKFHIVDLEQSVAARQQFTDQIGLITAGFYQAIAKKRGIGTDLGDEVTQASKPRTDIGVGEPLCYISIRYVDADLFPAYQVRDIAIDPDSSGIPVGGRRPEYPQRSGRSR